MNPLMFQFNFKTFQGYFVMKKIFFTLLLAALCLTHARAEENTLPQNFLFDDSDIIIKAPVNTDKEPSYSKKDELNAVIQAKKILNQKAAVLETPDIIKKKKTKKSSHSVYSQTTANEAPFGLLWDATIADTRLQGVQLKPAELKDYTNVFLATELPKPINIFDKVYLIFGKEDKLYRLLAYSRFFDDDNRATFILSEYKKFSDLLNKKYGNKQVFFTPFSEPKTSSGQNSKVDTSIGNPDFLNQLQSGQAVLYSTYHNDDIAAALSIGVDGDKKSYIVIDYKNLSIIKKQEAKTLDAL